LLCRALHNCRYLRYSICPTIYLSVSRSKRRTFRTGTVISGIRTFLDPSVIWASTSGSNYDHGDGDLEYAFWEIDNREYKFGDVDLCVHILLTYVFHWRTYFPWRTHFPRVRILAMNVTRRRYTDVRDSLTCVFYRRTSSTGVRICLAYVIWWRTHIVTTCSCDVRIFLAYIFYPRTYSIDVRVQSTYVFCERTWFRDGRFRDYAFGDRDSGLRSRNRGFGTTDLMQKTAVDSFLGLSIASKIIMTFVIYDCDVGNKTTV